MNNYIVNAVKRVIVPSGMDKITIDLKDVTVTVFANGKEPIVEKKEDKQFWLSKAVKFDLGVCPIYHRPVIIEKGLYGNWNLWFLKMEYTQGWYLGKDGLWYFEEKLKSLPLDNDRFEFLKNILFESPQQVYDFWKANVKEAKPLGCNQIRIS